MEELINAAPSIALGVGLAAACGFRVFVPLLGVSGAALYDLIPVTPGMAWLDSWPAFYCLLAATIVEVAAYYIPWVDNALDSLASPAAVVAGTLLAAAVFTDLPPMWRWSLALIAGGGAAGTVQATTTAARGVSTVATAGMGNFLVSTSELFLAVVTTVVSIVAPFVAIVLLIVMGLSVIRWVFFRRRPVTVRC
ncbi:MAG: DUF4126 domain-containing protein [Planctomycetaceae bacterium]|nr:DUF4126 domain-containing protein [Planctomycetaceae bacterium]